MKTTRFSAKREDVIKVHVLKNGHLIKSIYDSYEMVGSVKSLKNIAQAGEEWRITNESNGKTTSFVCYQREVGCDEWKTYTVNC